MTEAAGQDNGSVQNPESKIMSAHKKYLKLSRIDGEVELPGLQGTIELLGFHWGVAVELNTGGSDPWRLTFQDLTIKKLVDRTSPRLALACAQGMHFREAFVFVTQPVNGRPETYYRIHLRYVVVTRVESLPPLSGGMSEAEAAPREMVNLGYDEILWEYSGFDKAGRRQAWLKHGWSLRTEGEI